MSRYSSSSSFSRSAQPLSKGDTRGECVSPSLLTSHKKEKTQGGKSAGRAAAGRPKPSNGQTQDDRKAVLSQRCKAWNRDRDHQRRAGKGRASSFTSEYQSAAGHASFDAFSARFRAMIGGSPLTHRGAQYVRLQDIGHFSLILTDEEKRYVLGRWAYHGDLRDVEVLLAEKAWHDHKRAKDARKAARAYVQGVLS